MPNRIKSASVAVFANDTQLDRVQAFGVSARLDSEDLREIGNLDIVEVIDNVPTVDITLDINQYGSVKALRKMSGQNYDNGTMTVNLQYASGSVLVSSGYFYIGEVKYTKTTTTAIAVSASPGSFQKRIDTIYVTSGGTATSVCGTAVSGAAVPAAPAAPAGALVLALVQRNTNVSSAAIDMSYLNILNMNNSATVLLKDFEFSSCDFTVPVKETGDNTDLTYGITRTMNVEKAYVNRYDASFSVNGLATESYSLESDNKSWFLNTASNIWVDRFVGSGASAFTLSYTPITRDNGNKTLKAYKFARATGVYTNLVEGTDYTVAGAALTTTATVAVTDTLVVRYPAASVPAASQPFFKRVTEPTEAHPGIAGGLKHGQVEIYLSDAATTHVLRLQSVSISATLAREALYEIGHKRAYDRPMTFPIPITIQVEALSSDLAEFARLCGKTFASATELSIDQFIKNLDLTVKIYREDDVIRSTAPDIQSTPLKTITINEVSVTDENLDVRVDGNATQTFGLKANTNMSIVGLV
jgi:hypothetical protein